MLFSVTPMERQNAPRFKLAGGMGHFGGACGRELTLPQMSMAWPNRTAKPLSWNKHHTDLLICESNGVS